MMHEQLTLSNEDAASGTQQHTTHIPTAPVCSLCEQDKKTVPASNYCKDCYLYFCQPCLDNHNKYPMNRGHQLLDAFEIKAQPKDTLVSFPNRRCGQHVGEMINMYCPGHDCVCCNVCRAVSHGTCVDIQHLPEAAKGIKTKPMYHDAVVNLTNVVSEMETTLSQTDNDKKRIYREKLDIINALDDRRKQIVEHLDKIEKRSLEELEEREKKILQTIDNQSETLKSDKRTVVENLKLIENFHGDNECELFIDVKQGEKLVNEASGRLKPVKAYTPKLQFLFHAELTNIFKAKSSMGLVCNYVKIRTSSDKNICFVSDMCMLSNGMLLIVDLGNMMLKRLDSSYAIVDTLHLPGLVPESVCEIGPNQVMVYVNNQRGNVSTGKFMIHTVNIGGDRMTLTGSFPVDAGIEDLCGKMTFIEDFLYLIGSSKRGVFSPNSQIVIKVYSKFGALQRTMKLDQDICLTPLAFSRSTDGTRLYVCDKIKGLIVLDCQGKVLDCFDVCTSLKYPCDAFVINQTQFLICDYESHMVVKYDTERNDIKVLLRKSDGLHHPSAICYDKKNENLLVGQLSDRVSLHDLSEFGL